MAIFTSHDRISEPLTTTTSQGYSFIPPSYQVEDTMNERDEKNSESIEPVPAESSVKHHSSRRGFIRGALLTTVAFTATASLAKKASTLIPVPDHEDEARSELIAGDRRLKQRQYVVMTEKEKREYLDTLLENSRKSS